MYFVCFIFFTLGVVSGRETYYRSPLQVNPTCTYALADYHGWRFNNYLHRVGTQWSLLRVSNISTINVIKDRHVECLGYDDFLVIWHRYFLEGRLQHFLDISPETQHTCCHGHYRLYYEEGCQQGISYQAWEQSVFQCIDGFNPESSWVSRCRVDQALECNSVQEVSNRPISLRNCDLNKKQCNAAINRQNCWIYDYCRYWDTFNFYEQSLEFEIDLVEPFNCYCESKKYLKNPEVFVDVTYGKPKDRTYINSTVVNTKFEPEVHRRHREHEASGPTVTVVTDRPITPEVVSTEAADVPQTECICFDGALGFQPKPKNSTREFETDLYDFITIKGYEENNFARSLVPRYNLLCKHKGKLGWLKPLDALKKSAYAGLDNINLRRIMSENARKNSKSFREKDRFPDP